MSIKRVEYHKDYVDHLSPGTHFERHGADPHNAELLFWIYFAMTDRARFSDPIQGFW